VADSPAADNPVAGPQALLGSAAPWHHHRRHNGDSVAFRLLDLNCFRFVTAARRCCALPLAGSAFGWASHAQSSGFLDRQPVSRTRYRPLCSSVARFGVLVPN
jgi:hypothetical protein